LNAHQQAVSVSQTGKAPAAPAAPTSPYAGSDGAIWGTGKYQQLDPGWAEAFAVFLETALLGGAHPLVETPQVIPIPDSVQIALALDWGTGDWRTAANPAPSTGVGRHMSFLRPDLTIHLGDVYYSGTNDQEHYELVNIWPKGTIGSLALNSNHEMYSGAKPYFQAIANPPFEIQKGCSFFALENANWVIVGLDSAYYADAYNLYLDGALFPARMPNVQNAFLLQQGADSPQWKIGNRAHPPQRPR
jgi:hypothetical protein